MAADTQSAALSSAPAMAPPSSSADLPRAPSPSPSPSPVPGPFVPASSSPPRSPPPSTTPRFASLSIRLWPPNPSTRSTLVQRLSDHLSSATFFSERYGQIGAAEASLHAQRIEEQAFLAASRNVDLVETSDIAVVQFYAKEASRLMLECLKKGPSPAKEPEAQQQIETFFDISGGQREFLTEASAQELLQPLAVPGNAYSGICFSNRSFGEDAAKVAAKILEALKSQLNHVNLADIVAGRNEEEALAVMSIFSSALSGSNLKYLNLSHNALGEKGIRAFAELLASQRSLEELYFMNNGISEEAAMAIRELLPSSANLKVLHFYNNMTGDDGALALAGLVKEAPLLEDFRCSSTRVGSDGGIALSEALMAGSCLKKLDLRDNPYGVEGALALAKALKQHRNLKEVYFSYLCLGDEGTMAILEAMEESGAELEVLDLGGNDITVTSVPKLASFITSKPKLTKLNLSENDLEDKGVVTICNVLGKGHEALVELDLSETNIGRIGACAAAEAVSLKSGFKVLNLNGNHISEAGIEALKDVLQRGRHGGVSVLGTLEENDENEDGAEDEDNGNEGENGDDELQAEFQKVKV